MCCLLPLPSLPMICVTQPGPTTHLQPHHCVINRLDITQHSTHFHTASICSGIPHPSHPGTHNTVTSYLHRHCFSPVAFVLYPDRSNSVCHLHGPCGLVPATVVRGEDWTWQGAGGRPGAWPRRPQHVPPRPS